MYYLPFRAFFISLNASHSDLMTLKSDTYPKRSYLSICIFFLFEQLMVGMFFDQFSYLAVENIQTLHDILLIGAMVLLLNFTVQVGQCFPGMAFGGYEG